MAIEPKPYRTLRALTSSILTHEELRRKAPEGSEERWRIERKLAAFDRQLDEAEAVWATWQKGGDGENP